LDPDGGKAFRHHYRLALPRSPSLQATIWPQYFSGGAPYAVNSETVIEDAGVRMDVAGLASLNHVFTELTAATPGRPRVSLCLSVCVTSDAVNTGWNFKGHLCAV